MVIYATREVVSNPGVGSPNRLAYNVPSDSGQLPPPPPPDTTPPPPPVDSAPIARFNVTCPWVSCRFDAHRSTDDVGIVLYKWDFGDSTRLETISSRALHDYAVGGQYLVTLTVVDTKGQEGSAESREFIKEKRGRALDSIPVQ